MERVVRRSLGLLSVLVLAGGCSSWHAQVPVLSFDVQAAGIKMLRPDAHVSICRTRVLGITIAGDASPLDAASRALLALDGEADTLSNVRIDTSEVTTGLFDRSCVTLHADVGRSISVVRVPAPPGHHEHHP